MGENFRIPSCSSRIQRCFAHFKSAQTCSDFLFGLDVSWDIVQVERLEGISHFGRVSFMLEHVVGFNALVDVGVSWSLISPSLRCIADGTFLKTFCADRFSLVFFSQGRCFCLTMAVYPKLAVLRLMWCVTSSI